VTPFIRSILKGCAAAFVLTVILQFVALFAASIIPVSATNMWIASYPWIVGLFPLVLGGYFAAVGSPRWYVGSFLTGAILASIAVLAGMAFGVVGGIWWFVLGFILFAGFLSGLGGVAAKLLGRA
jgi:hypothetical protein